MRTRLSTLLGVVVTSAVLAAQAPGRDTPTFRTGANYVRVDMYATLDGQPVTDLRPDEIQILEDDVPQTIDAFEHVHIAAAGAEPARPEPQGVGDSRQQAADARARVFVIFLDTYHTRFESSAGVRLPLVRFLDRALGPDDLVALMTPEMSASDISFGRKAAAISNIMQEEWAWGRRGRLSDDDPKEALYDSCGSTLGTPLWAVEEMKGRRREKLTLDALEDLVVHLGGVREERKAVLTISEGWILYERNRNLAEASAGAARPPAFRAPVPPPAERGQVSNPLQIECEADRLALAVLEHDTRLRRLAEDANRNNVTFYPVFARGLVTSDSDLALDPAPRAIDDAARRGDAPVPLIDGAARLRRRQDSLRLLADNTDGSAVLNTNNIAGALTRISGDLSSYYLLGYYSTNTQLDGRFRSITVRVTRPGVRVRARRGYRGRTAEEVLSDARAGGGASGSPALTSALGAVANVDARSRFRIRSSSWSAPAADGEAAGSFWIVGELDYRTRRELAWTAGARAEIVVLAADGQQVSAMTVPIGTDDGAFSIRVPESGALPAGDYAVRVKVSPEGDDSLALSDLARVVIPGTAAPFGDAVLWRRGRSTGPRYLRTADLRFQRSDRVRLELPTSGAVTGVTARMLDRAGQPLTIPVQVSDRVETPGEGRWIVVDATLAPLAPGDYAIEVRQGEARQVTAFRVVP